MQVGAQRKNKTLGGPEPGPVCVQYTERGRGGMEPKRGEFIRNCIMEHLVSIIRCLNILQFFICNPPYSNVQFNAF